MITDSDANEPGPSASREGSGAPSSFISNVPLPPRLHLGGNLSENWKQWKQIYDAFETVTNLKSKPDNFRVAAFITCLGPEALNNYNSLPYQDEDERQNIERIFALWNAYCIGETNVIYERATETTTAQVKAMTGHAGDPDLIANYVSKQRSPRRPSGDTRGLISECKFCGRSHKRSKESCQILLWLRSQSLQTQQGALPDTVMSATAEAPLSAADIENNFGSVFQGLGHMPGRLHLDIDESQTPVVMPPRRVPIALKVKLKAELERLEELGVIRKVTGPTDWVSNLAIAEKSNGKLRLCTDP
eukprot:gene7650-8490_t